MHMDNLVQSSTFHVVPQVQQEISEYRSGVNTYAQLGVPHKNKETWQKIHVLVYSISC